VRPLASTLLAVALFAPGPGRAEVYRWTDAEGRLHFSGDLAQVPPEQRAAALAGAAREAESDRVQRVSTGRPRMPRREAAQRPGRRVEVAVERAGTALRVVARLNDRFEAPFLVDTGASDVMLPRWVADELGLELAGSRTQLYQTANGVVQAPVVTLDSIELGGARAEQVAASVGEGMPVGLLGLSFLNRFHYAIDSARGLLTLEPADHAEADLHGGRSEAEWRAQFGQLRARRTALEARRARLLPSHTRLREALEEEGRRLEAEGEELELEADRGNVPQAWRH
jgi:clan AA aspartic protease (TIGR02281 family)